MKPIAVELFAGGGGLAVGLRNAGLVPVAAVELNEYAAATFSANHPRVKLIKDDIRNVAGKLLLAASPTKRVDVLAACPPCQGFSSLTSKYRRADARNVLVSEVGRIARETLPLAIMIENVPGLATKGKPILDELIFDLTKLGYRTSFEVLQVADYGVPQLRRRLVLLAGLGFDITMPAPTHSSNPTNGLPRWKTIRDVIGDSEKAITIDRAAERGGFSAVDWHVVRRLGEANLARLKAARPGLSRASLPIDLRPECHKSDAAGFRNTYGRMEWDRPSPTITAGCLSPSKGRFGHPSQLRTISLREAATIQTFPKNYKFVGDYIDQACSVVGNALPCLFAQRIAEHVAATLQKSAPKIPAKLQARRENLR